MNPQLTVQDLSSQVYLLNDSASDWIDLQFAADYEKRSSSQVYLAKDKCEIRYLVEGSLLYVW